MKRVYLLRMVHRNDGTALFWYPLVMYELRPPGYEYEEPYQDLVEPVNDRHTNNSPTAYFVINPFYNGFDTFRHQTQPYYIRKCAHHFQRNP